MSFDVAAIQTLLNETHLLDSPLAHWLGGVVTFLLVWLGLATVVRGTVKRLYQLAKKTANTVDDFIVALLDDIRGFVFGAIALSVATWWLPLPGDIRTIANGLPVLAVLGQIGLWSRAIIEFAVDTYINKQQDPRQVAILKTMRGPFQFMGVFTIWALVALVALQNLGVDVTALIAGLGIGGIAIALAVQTILGDLFAAFSIVVDKPFVVGDFIVSDNVVGTVQHIGLKTTRIAALSGELMVISNSDLLGSRVQNYAYLTERRIVFPFGVLYQTPQEKVTQVSEWVKAIIEGIDGVRFDRCHFKIFGDSSLDFEVVYFVLDGDYTVYMDKQHAINVAMLEKFATEGVEFAYPTRTLFLSQEEPLQLATTPV